MSDTALAKLSLSAVSEAIEKGEVSSEDVTRNCLERLESAHPRLNCVAGMAAEAALDDARKADQVRSSGQSLGPLHGVPLAHKDMYYRKGRVSACGSKIRADFVPEFTATVLGKLDAAGALDIARLNMVEFAYGLTGHNEITGNVHNPWNLDYITGGSSSGPAVSVSAGLVYGTLGSDTGGSIRFPASCCGLVGMKPTYGRVSRYGAMPLSHTLDHVGPLTRTVRDCALLTQTIAGADPNDRTCSTRTVGDYLSGLENLPKGLKVGVPSNYFYDPIHPEVRVRMTESLKVFKDLGIEVRELAMPETIYASNAMVNLIAGVEGASHHALWLRERSQDYGIQTLGRLRAGLLYLAVDYMEALNLREVVLQDFLERVFTQVDVLHVPIVPIPLPTLEESDVGANPGFIDYISQLGHCTRPFDYLGLPALAVPAGTTSNGLPTGFQLVGRPFAEASLFQTAAAFEAASPWTHPIED